MNVSSIGSSNTAMLQSLLKSLQTNSSASVLTSFRLSDDKSTGTTTQPSSAGQPDAKSLLERLALSQPSLVDFLTGSSSGDSAGSDNLLNFDPESAALNAFLGDNSDSSSSDSLDADPLSAFMGSQQATFSSADLSTILEKLYAQSDVDSEDNQPAGQSIDIQR